LVLLGVIPAMFSTPPADLIELVGIVPVATVYVAVFSLPFAIVGIPLVHVLSCWVASQAAQVAITGCVTVVVVGAGLAWLSGSLVFGLGTGAMTAVATMTGRAAVIPSVRRTRHADFRPRERLQA
jgi:hypothetical protein